MAGPALERPSRAAGGPLAGYRSACQRLPHVAYDEAMSSGGRIRSHYGHVLESLREMSAEGLAQRAEALTGAHRSKGITFDLEGEERIFPLDLVPRILDEPDWRLVQTGVAQRVRALEAFLADIYGAGRVVQEGIIPAAVITSSPQFTRAAHGFSPPNGVRIHVSGIDIVRDENGQLCVLEDNVRCPSGVSYVLANRAAMAQMLPELFTGQRVQPVTEYPARLLAALRAAAPHGVAEPTVVVFTPGVYNSAFYEHALLARLDGRGTCRGARPRRPRHESVRADHRRRSAGARHLPPDRRRLSSTRCTSGRTHSSAAPACSTPPARAASPSPTRSATGSRTTSSSTAMSPTSSAITSTRRRCCRTCRPPALPTPTYGRRC